LKEQGQSIAPSWLQARQAVQQERLNYRIMFRNFFKTTFRNFRRNKVFTAINIAGLAIGISAALVIYLIVSHEQGYEKFHKDGDRIYRVVTDMHFPDFSFKNGGVPGPLPAAMKREIPGIEVATHFWMQHAVKTSVPREHGAALEFRRQEKIMFAYRTEIG